MGISGISPWSLLLILLIVVLFFGTKRLRTLGKDLGEMTKSFKQGINETAEMQNEINTNLESQADSDTPITNTKKPSKQNQE